MGGANILFSLPLGMTFACLDLWDCPRMRRGLKRWIPSVCNVILARCPANWTGGLPCLWAPVSGTAFHLLRIAFRNARSK